MSALMKKLRQRTPPKPRHRPSGECRCAPARRRRNCRRRRPRSRCRLPRGRTRREHWSRRMPSAPKVSAVSAAWQEARLSSWRLAMNSSSAPHRLAGLRVVGHQFPAQEVAGSACAASASRSESPPRQGRPRRATEEQWQLGLLVELEAGFIDLAVHVDRQVGQAQQRLARQRTSASPPGRSPCARTTRPARPRSRSAKVARMGPP
jgi:hypothetical protein